MSLVTALDTLAAMSVSGVKKSFKLADLRGGVTQADLPALVPVPVEGTITRAAYSKAGTVHDLRHQVRHRLLERPMQGAHQGEALAATAALIDTYLLALRTLTPTPGALDISPTGYEAGIVEWGGIEYYGCDFLVLIEE